MSRPNNIRGCADAAIPVRRSPAARGAPRAGRHLRRHLLACLIGGALAAGAVALPATSWAQSANARVRGTAPPDTEITAFNVATGVTRHTRSSADGSYTLVGLPPGTYTIDAGPGTQRTVTLSVASTSTLNLTSPAAAQPTPSTANATELQGVEVVAGAIPEVKTSEVATTISQHQIDTIPQISRNFLEFADIVPGMVFSVAANGNTSLRAGALNNSQVNVFIDGVSQKSYVMGGGIAGQNASQGNPFPELAIGQYKVITSNYKAEYAQLSSAAITSVTKSGTNEFHGEAFERYTNDGYRARTPAEIAADKKTPSHEREYGVALGGPIIKDKMHFFVTYAAKRFGTPTAIAPSADAVPGVPYLPAGVTAQFGPANLPFEEDLYFAKLDWEPTDRDRFELSARIRKESTRSQIGGTKAASSALDQKNTDKRYVLKWDHSGNRWFNEMMLTHQYTFFQPTPIETGNGYIYTWDLGTRDPVLIHTGPASPLAAQNKGQKGWTFKDDLTLSDFQWHGDHVIKMGVVYRDLTLKAADALNINPQFTWNVTTAGVDDIPYKAFFTKPVTGLSLSPTVVTKDKQYGFYIQDDWAVNDKLTLNLGLRWDYEDNPSYTDFVTPPNVIDALLNGSIADRPGATPGETFNDALVKAGIDIHDYISTGSNRSNDSNNWQPRLGFSYDINADQAHVIHGGMGRSYDRNLYNYLQLETTKAALPQFTVWFRDPDTGTCRHDSTPCFDWDPAYLDGLANLQALVQAHNGGEIDMLDNNLKTPYSDKFSLGMSNRIGQWQTDATVVRTLYHDGFAFTLGGRHPDGSFWGGPNNSQWGQSVPGFGGLILGSNGISVRSTQVLLSAKKPFTVESGWGATFAYTFTHAKQNRDISQHYSFDYPTIHDYPFITSNAAAKHRIVMTGSLDGPWGLVFGAKLTLATPLPWNGIACYGPNSAYAKAGNQAITFPNGSYCQAAAATPPGGRFLVGGKIWGYRDVDFQVTKNFDLPYGVTLYARLDLLNAFNFKNYVGYRVDSSGPPGDVQVTYNPTGAITYAPRTVKFELGVRF